jgi:hypothetical protein
VNVCLFLIQPLISSLIGAGSIALAKNLGVSDRPRKGSVENGIVMVVFPNSSQKPNWPLSNDEIDKQGNDLFAKWGGPMDRHLAGSPGAGVDNSANGRENSSTDISILNSRNM